MFVCFQPGFWEREMVKMKGEKGKESRVEIYIYRVLFVIVGGRRTKLCGNLTIYFMTMGLSVSPLMSNYYYPYRQHWPRKRRDEGCYKRGEG